MKKFCIKCDDEKEFEQIQLYLFKLNYEWIDSEKTVFFPKYENYPLFIQNHDKYKHKFIWQNCKNINDQNIIFISAKNYLRKHKLQKLSLFKNKI